MQPYYQDAFTTLYHGDCREVLPTLPRDSVDLLLTDPPYGVRWQSNFRQQTFAPIAGDEDVDAALEGVRLSLPALRHGRHVYTFGRYAFTGLPLTEPVELIWDKVNQIGGDLSCPWGQQHERIQFAVYRPSFANLADGRGRLAARIRKGSVLRHLRPNGVAVTDHPSEKPVPLLRELIESSSCLGETVLDPFVGVGSTLEACLWEGRKGIGVEIEERYAEIAARRCERLARALSQLNMALETA